MSKDVRPAHCTHGHAVERESSPNFEQVQGTRGGCCSDRTHAVAICSLLEVRTGRRHYDWLIHPDHLIGGDIVEGLHDPARPTDSHFLDGRIRA